MEISGLNVELIADFLTGSSKLDSATFERNINGNGKLSLSWRSANGGGLNAGQEVSVVDGEATYTYYLSENYAPTPNGDGTYTWSPSFVSTDNRLKGIIVYRTITVTRQTVGDSVTKQMNIYTFPYTGTAGTIVEHLRGILGSDGTISLNSRYENVSVTVSFDQDSVVSACQKIASALKTNMTIVDGGINIGTDSALATSERFDRFVILGGTRNMGKYVMDGDDTYAAVTFRLMLPDDYPDSVYPANTPASGHMTKILIFDDIYPKIELQIGSVRERICYLYDDDGKIIYTNKVVDGVVVKVPKTYTKYYITLSQMDGSAYNFDLKSVIEGRTLGIVFQSGLLCSREFDLSYYTDSVDETNSDEDVNPDGWVSHAGEYRICLVADGETLLPNSTLKPSAGDVVTMTGVALDGSYETIARNKLLQEALPYVNMYMSTQSTDAVSEADEVIEDFLTGDTVVVNPGQKYGDGDYIVTSVTTDILTGNQSVHYGTFEPESRMQSMANMLETASLSASGATVGQASEDYIRNTAPMSLEQFATLYNIYGHLGMKTVANKVTDLQEDFHGMEGMFEEVMEQADQSFQLWFGGYTPSEELWPSSEWLTPSDKALHLNDIFYDTDREPGTTGGRAWRWEREATGTYPIDGENVVYDAELGTVTVNGTVYNVTDGEIKTTDGVSTFYIYSYQWNEILDADTLASLERIADVTNDGILSGGSEKSRIRIEWMNAVSIYDHLKTQSAKYGVSDKDSAYYSKWTTYNDAYVALAKMLNADANASEAILTGLTYPEWLDDSHLQINTTVNAGTYRSTWKAYYDAEAALNETIVKIAKDLADAAQNTADTAMSRIDDIISDGIISGGSEKSEVYLDWMKSVDEYKKYILQAKDYFGDNNTEDDALVAAYTALAKMLNNDVTPSQNILDGVDRPNWINATNISVDTVLEEVTIGGVTGSADAYRNVWKDYYTELTTLLELITKKAREIALKAQQDAEKALKAIEEMSSDGVLSLDELPLLRREFETVYRKREEMIDLATDDTTFKLIDTALRDPVDTYLASFNTLVGYLQKTSGTWNDPGTYNVNNGSSVASADATYEVEAKVPLSATDFPVLLKQTAAVKFQDDWSNPTEQGDGGVKFRNLWADLASKELALANAITTLANNTAKDAQSTADAAQYDASVAMDAIVNMSSDAVITAAEKKQLIRQWENVVAENSILTAQGEAVEYKVYGALRTYYQKSYKLWYALRWFRKQSGSIPTSIYKTLTQIIADSRYGDVLMLRNGKDTTLSSEIEVEVDGDTITYTTISYTDFNAAWDEYYAAAESLRAGINAAEQNVFVTTENERPNPPYKEGDIWIRKMDNGTYETYTCVYGRNEDDWGYESDWEKMLIPKNPDDMRSTLAAVADAAYKQVSANTDLDDGDLIAVISLGSSSSISPSIDAVTDATLDTLYNYLGSQTIGIYYGSGGGNQYDMICTPVTTIIPGSNETLVGGITIQMYNGSGWEYIQQSTSSLLNNLGNAVNAIVFGSNNAATEAAGLTVGQKFAKLFSQATLYDTATKTYKTLSQALFGLSINVDSEGRYYSTAKLQADVIDFSAGTFSIGAGHIDFTAGTYTIGADHISFAGKTISLNSTESLTFSGGTINMTAVGTLNLNASQLTWNGETVINNGTTDTFAVDGDGNVTVCGVIKADTGYIGGSDGWTIEAKKLHSGTIGSSGSMWLATENLTATIGGKSHSDLRLTVGSNFAVKSDGTLIASNANISGSLTIPADAGDFTFAKSNDFGLYISSSTAFTSNRADYLKGSTARGAVLRIQLLQYTSSFRGIYCDGEVEFQGTTQLLRRASEQNDTSKNALIVEGIDDKNNLTVGGNAEVTGNIVSKGNFALKGGLYHIANGTTKYLPSSPVDGQVVFAKGFGGSSYIGGNGHAILNGNGTGEVASSSGRWNISTATALLVYDSTQGAWLMIYSA